MKTFLYPLELRFKYLKYFFSYRRKRKELGFTPNIKTIPETIDYILQNKCSVSRFGDGEINIIKGKGNGFCLYHPFIAQKMEEVLTIEIPKHIVCIPRSIFDQEDLLFQPKVFWKAFFCKTFPLLSQLLKKEYTYFDASFTRFYLSYKDKSKCKEIIQKIKAIWEKQDILLIEGEFSRLGVNNNLFDNAHSLQRILCPTKNAYEKYEEIFDQIQKYGKNKLILLALGQTATALAYDLAKKNYWAIDMGHIDIEYEWFLCNAKRKIKIDGKHVNEVGYIPLDNIIQNQKYQQQILAKIL